MKIQGHGATVQAYAATAPISAKSTARTSGLDEPRRSSAQGNAPAEAIDFSNMTKSEMKKVAQHLYETGKIDLTQLGMIQMAGPLGKAGPNGEFIPFTQAEREQIENTPTNYLNLVQGAIGGIESRHQANDPTSGYADWKHILSVLQAPQDAMPSVDVTA